MYEKLPVRKANTSIRKVHEKNAKFLQDKKHYIRRNSKEKVPISPKGDLVLSNVSVV